MTTQKLNQGAIPKDRPRLDAVPEEYRDTINDLFDTWASVSPRNRLIRQYYEMHKETKNLGISIPPQCESVNSVVGWCAKAVAAHANRSKFDAFLFAGKEDTDLKRLVRDNNFKSLYQSAYKSALVYGLSTMTVMRGSVDQPTAKVRVFSANQSCVLWDKDKDRIKAGVVLADIDRENRPQKYIVHTSDAVLTLERDRATVANPHSLGDYVWTCEVEYHSMGRPMMVAIVNDPDPDRPLGHSMITPELMGIVDKAMRDVLRMEVGAEFFTAPQRYILGAAEDLFSEPVKAVGENEDGEPIDEDGNVIHYVDSPQAKWKAYLGSFLSITRDENGEIPQVGQFSAGNANNFTAVFENDAQRFSGATNVPLAQLGVLSNTYTSSDALNATDNPLILEVEVANDRNAEVLQEVARMMMAINANVPMADLTEEQKNVQALFVNPSLPTIAARADAWSKFGGSDNSIIGTHVWYEGFGLPSPTIDRLEAEKETKSVTSTMNDLADALTQKAVGANG